METKFDFIPRNEEADQRHVELICRCIINDMGSKIYDGRNVYAKAVAICRHPVTGEYKWESTLLDKEYEKLFYPTTKELEAAMRIFKDKGYHPYYDNDVCYYKVAKDRKEVRGEHAIAHTIWL